MVLFLAILLGAIHTGIRFRLVVLREELSKLGVYNSRRNLTYWRVHKALKETTNEYIIQKLLKVQQVCIWSLLTLYADLFLIIYFVFYSKKYYTGTPINEHPIAIITNSHPYRDIILGLISLISFMIYFTKMKKLGYSSSLTFSPKIKVDGDFLAFSKKPILPILLFTALGTFLWAIFDWGSSVDAYNRAKLQNTQNSDTNKTISPIDTLNKYIGSDTIHYCDYGNFFAGKVNGQDIGLFPITDTSYAIYQKDNGKWRITDTTHPELEYVEQIDINGDGYKDIVLTYEDTAAGNNYETDCYLFDTTTKKFKYNDYYHLPNIFYDKKTKLVHTSWWTTAINPTTKMTYELSGDCFTYKETYQITGDSLTLKDIAEYEPNKDSTIASISFYKIKGNKEIMTKRITGNSDKMWALFRKTLWDSDASQ